MEKIEWLISKLQRQYEAEAGAGAMLATLQLLQTELSQQLIAGQTNGTVTVVLPAPRWNTNATDEIAAYDAESFRSADEEKVVFELDPFVHQQEETETIPAPVVTITLPPETHMPYLPEKRNITPPPVVTPPVVTPPAPPPVTASVPTPPAITPSIEAVEMKNPTIPTDQKSLNDLLEKPADELFTRLHEPVKDLKKAISINDRYQYINNLFRGDETMYDRSIKTINNFNVFSEAEFWIRRELAAKHGWKDNDELVQQFLQLVRRRFS